MELNTASSLALANNDGVVTRSEPDAPRQQSNLRSDPVLALSCDEDIKELTKGREESTEGCNDLEQLRTSSVYGQQHTQSFTRSINHDGIANGGGSNTSSPFIRESRSFTCTTTIPLRKSHDFGNTSCSNSISNVEKPPTTPRATRKSFLAANTGSKVKQTSPVGNNIPIFFDAMTTSYAVAATDDLPRPRSDSDDIAAFAAHLAAADNSALNLSAKGESVSPRTKRPSLRFSSKGGGKNSVATDTSRTSSSNSSLESSPRSSLKKFLFRNCRQQLQHPLVQPIQLPQKDDAANDQYDSYQTPMQPTRPRIRPAPRLPTIEASPTMAADFESPPGRQSYDRYVNLATASDSGGANLEIELDGDALPYQVVNDEHACELGGDIHYSGHGEQEFKVVGDNIVADGGDNVTSAHKRPAREHHDETEVGVNSSAAEYWNDNLLMYEDLTGQTKPMLGNYNGQCFGTDRMNELSFQAGYESIYLQELQGQRVVPVAQMELERQLLSDEELARRLQEEFQDMDEAKNVRQLSSETECDAELASRVATMLMRDELNARRSADTNTQLLDQSSIDEQQEILEQIRREREFKSSGGRLHEVRHSLPTGSIAQLQHDTLVQSSHSRVQSNLSHHNRVPTRPDISANDSAAHQRTQHSETLEQMQRRKEAFDRQFYDRTTGSVDVTPFEREAVRRHESLGSKTYHAGDRGHHEVHHAYIQGPSRPHGQMHQARPVSVGPDDWEYAQRQALLEFERARHLQVHTSKREPTPVSVNSEHRNAYPWQTNHNKAHPVQPSPLSDDRLVQSNMLRRGQGMTQRAVRSGQSHIVLCQGCGNRLQAPVHSSLVYCPSCGVVSPGQAAQQPFAISSSHGRSYGLPRAPRVNSADFEY